MYIEYARTYWCKYKHTHTSTTIIQYLLIVLKSYSAHACVLLVSLYTYTKIEYCIFTHKNTHEQWRAKRRAKVKCKWCKGDTSEANLFRSKVWHNLASLAYCSMTCRCLDSLRCFRIVLFHCDCSGSISFWYPMLNAAHLEFLAQHITQFC